MKLLKRVLSSLLVVTMLLGMTSVNVYATLEDSYNSGEQIEGLSIEKLEIKENGQTLEAGNASVSMSIKFNQKISKDYNVFIHMLNETEAKQIVNPSKAEYTYFFRPSDTDTDEFNFENSSVMEFDATGKYIAYFVVISNDETGDQQLIRLDENMQQSNYYYVENSWYDSEHPVVKSVTLDKNAYKPGDTVKVKVEVDFTINSDQRLQDTLNLTFGTGTDEYVYINGEYLEMELQLQDDGLSYYGEAQLVEHADYGNWKLRDFDFYGVLNWEPWGGLVNHTFANNNLLNTYFQVNKNGEFVSSKPEFKFVDVSEKKWYYSTVKEVFQLGLLTGLDENHFSPETEMTRGMVATVLHRMSGKPEVNYEPIFPDVSSKTYCANAVIWAYKNKVISGYNTGKFGPNDNVTREQMAVMLWNYARSQKLDVNQKASLTDFKDYKAVSSYATNAFEWAVANKVITGTKDKELNPKGNATRAECSKMLLAVYKMLNK